MHMLPLRATSFWFCLIQFFFSSKKQNWCKREMQWQNIHLQRIPFCSQNQNMNTAIQSYSLKRHNKEATCYFTVLLWGFQFKFDLDWNERCADLWFGVTTSRFPRQLYGSWSPKIQIDTLQLPPDLVTFLTDPLKSMELKLVMTTSHWF